MESVTHPDYLAHQLASKIRASKMTLVIFASIEFLITMLYVFVVRRNYHKIAVHYLHSNLGARSAEETMFSLVTYFGITFAVVATLVAFSESYCFALCFTSTNLVHVIICLIKSSAMPVFWGYILTNALLTLSSFFYSRQLRTRALALAFLSPSGLESGPSGSQGTSIFNIESTLLKSLAERNQARINPPPPSYNEVTRHPERYPELFSNDKELESTSTNQPEFKEPVPEPSSHPHPHT